MTAVRRPSSALQALFLLLVIEAETSEGLEPEDMSRKCMIYWEKKRYRFGFIVMQPRKRRVGLENPTNLNFVGHRKQEMGANMFFHNYVTR